MVIAMFRNSGMAYRAVIQTRKHPYWPPLMWKTLNAGWKREAEQTVLDSLKGTHFRSKLRTDGIHYVAVIFRNMTKPQIRALLDFFQSPVGKAVGKATDDGFRAAMDDAFDRIMARFNTGHPEPGLAARAPASRAPAAPSRGPATPSRAQ